MPDDTAMTARQAWDWLATNEGYGVRADDVHVFMPAPGIVEVSRAGMGTSVPLDQPQFLNDFSWATFKPLDTADYAA